jgi:hypothetical protein
MKLTVVFESNNRLDAEIMLGMLESQEIPAFLSCDDAAGLYPGMEAYFGCRLSVHEENVHKALEIIEGVPED